MGCYRALAPLLRLVPPERAHALALGVLASRWAARVLGHGSGDDPPSLETRVLGLDFANPIGLAAGFDKDGVAIDGLLGLGFGFVEVGTATPRPQAGNPKPRLFRLPEHEALINRMGFNNQGLAALAAKLAKRHRRNGIVGANIGRNRDSADAIADYVAGFEALYDEADYLVVNVSSPNTPGLRDLQARDRLSALIAALMASRARHASAIPILVKIAPDLAPEGLRDLTALALEMAVDGLVIGNTTTARDGLPPCWRDQAGGLSGRPLFARSTTLLAETYRLSEGRLPLIGVGGVAGADDAYAKIRAGASLVQVFTALVYDGPGLVGRIKRGLAARLAAGGLARVADAVGADV